MATMRNRYARICGSFIVFLPCRRCGTVSKRGRDCCVEKPLPPTPSPQRRGGEGDPLPPTPSPQRRGGENAGSAPPLRLGEGAGGWGFRQSRTGPLAVTGPVPFLKQSPNGSGAGQYTIQPVERLRPVGFAL